MSEEKATVKRPIKRVPRKKVCNFCVDKAEEIDYKDVAKGQDHPQAHERRLREAPKNARTGDQESEVYGAVALRG